MGLVLFKHVFKIILVVALAFHFTLKFPTELATYDDTVAIRLVTLRSLPLSMAPEFHVI